MKTETIYQYQSEARHRFLGYYQREVLGQPAFIYRCVCGYLEAAPLAGGPFTPLDINFQPRPDARGLVKHLDLDRAHELN